jgi:ureidoacrylate peracid hydrolase
VLTTLTEVADPGHTAIIVIDMQNEIVSDQGGYATRTETGQTFATGHQALIPKIQALLDAARRRGILVTFAEYIHRNRLGGNLMDGPNYFGHQDQTWISCAQDGTWGAQTIDELAPEPGDIVFTKSRGSAFSGTDLELTLRSRGIRTLVLTGTGSGGCVAFTCSDALMHGFYAVTVTDAIFNAGPGDVAMAWMGSLGPECSTDQLLEMWSDRPRRSEG